MKFIFIILVLLISPMMLGIVNQTKAFFAGRRGPGLFRLYYDLFKLITKSTPRSSTSTWVFDLAPAIGLAATLAAAVAFPSSAAGAVIFFYLLGLARFLTVLGALDTGSAFEGMGASREVQFSALVEPIVFIVIAFIARHSESAFSHPVPMFLTVLAFFVVMLSENCRVPFDDPETHLELTMIHEAMILDNSGPDLAYILYAAALKFSLLAAFLVWMFLPLAWVIPCLPLVAMIVGIVESIFARMRFLKTPQILMSTGIVALLAVLISVLF